ncbi:SDR family oxidoreductase [Streptantibioticus rubrisoli]|uniref:SDR family oxidoreductase n=1 Tax=Streptantibioticus rubrisoli TaxID=1387313 RepID=A0ABT1PB67_9ACTN|nr:SDR family oxidoreductase [Streptantibioticus rubrisoli]MCQ4042591.1 SDR family oxidoreductase [Streptantibioticus rubrisoli]
MRILVTGATGVVGTEVTHRLTAAAPAADTVRTARRAGEPGVVPWTIGREPVPASLTGHWDVIVHTAAATRWTLTRAEATEANIVPLREVLALADRETHFVHVSTAYVGGTRGPQDLTGAEFEGYRNGYEWSKAVCEDIVTEHRGPVTVVRPPLVMGRRTDGVIARFSGPYSLFPALVSGLAAVVVGDPDGHAEIGPVDEVADAIVTAACGAPPATPRTEVISAGEHGLRLGQLVDVTCAAINDFRAAHGVAPIERPPTVSTDSWNRFFLPLAEQWLSPVQRQAVRLLAMFQSYTSMSEPFTPTRLVADPARVVEVSVRYWARRKPRQALAAPSPWTMVTAR